MGKRLLKASFIIYADFERILKPVTDNINDDPNNKIILFAVMGTN